jgi:hypothetical protein
MAPMAIQFLFGGTTVPGGSEDATTAPEPDVTEEVDTGVVPESTVPNDDGIAAELIDVTSPDLTSSRRPLSSL